MDEKASVVSEAETDDIPIDVKYEPLVIKDEFPSTDDCEYTDITRKTYFAIKSDYGSGTDNIDDVREFDLQFHSNYECDIKQESDAFTEMNLTAAADSKLIEARDISQTEAHDFTIKSEYSGGTDDNNDVREGALQFRTNYECDIKQESNAITKVHLTAAGDRKLAARMDISQTEVHDCKLPHTQVHHCDICQQPFATAEYLIAHRYTHTDDANYTCIICRNTFHLKQHLHRHMLNNHFNLSPFLCDTCHKSFTRKRNLTEHKRIHSGVKLYSCDMCHKSFTQNCKLSVHKRIHTGEKPYECDICHKSFRQKRDLTIHTRIHTGDKPYECHICYTSYVQKSNLNVHKRIHTGEKPYKCDVCHKSFTLKTNLTVHKRKHTGEKPFACDLCDKSFSRNNELTIHKRVHTGEKPYACDICHSSFTQNGDLTIHTRIHTGEKPYECDICHKLFKQKGELTIHKRIHTDEKPYECDVCHKSFRRKNDVSVHIRIHTGGKSNAL